MSCFRNGGTGDAPIAKYGGFWQGMLLDGGGTTFDDNVIALPDAYGGLNLVDINGDGRAVCGISLIIAECTSANVFTRIGYTSTLIPPRLFTSTNAVANETTEKACTRTGSKHCQQ